MVWPVCFTSLVSQGQGNPFAAKYLQLKDMREWGKAEKCTASEFDNFKLHLCSDNWGNAAQRLGLASTMKFLQYSRNLQTARKKLLIFDNKKFTSASTDMSAPS